jgi:RNA polymerase sigma-70 factor (ECF subfamily)
MSGMGGVRFDDRDDEDLLAMVADRPEAFAALYRRYERTILSFLVRRVPSADIAADLHLEVFAAALGGLRDGRGPRGSVAAWLFGIARHKIADSYRRGKVETAARHALAMQPVTLEDEDLKRIEMLRGPPEILGWLEDLPADQRDAVVAIVDERAELDVDAPQPPAVGEPEREVAAPLACSPPSDPPAATEDAREVDQPVIPIVTSRDREKLGGLGGNARKGVPVRPSMRFSYSTALGTRYTASPPITRIRPRAVWCVSPSQSSSTSSVARSRAAV